MKKLLMSLLFWSILIVFLNHHLMTQDACAILRAMPRFHNSSLPRIIHFQWQNYDMPPFQLEIFNKYRKLYPNHTIFFWTDDLMEEFMNQTSKLFNFWQEFPLKIQKIDSARYFILQAFGGLYVDLDYEPFGDFWPLLHPSKVTLPESPIRFAEDVQNSLMASPPHHSFWTHVIAALKHEGSIGTGMLSRIASKHPYHKLPCAVFMRMSPMTWSNNDVITSFWYKYVLFYTPFMRSCGYADFDDRCMLTLHWGTAWYSSHRIP